MLTSRVMISCTTFWYYRLCHYFHHHYTIIILILIIISIIIIMVINIIIIYILPLVSLFLLLLSLSSLYSHHNYHHYMAFGLWIWERFLPLLSRGSVWHNCDNNHYGTVSIKMICLVKKLQSKLAITKRMDPDMTYFSPPKSWLYKYILYNDMK